MGRSGLKNLYCLGGLPFKSFVMGLPDVWDFLDKLSVSSVEFSTRF